jgi:SAM-dependent methyltransferase
MEKTAHRVPGADRSHHFSIDSFGRCRICGHSGTARLYRAPETMFGTGEKFDYFVCSECGCLQIRDIPEDMARYYPHDYYSVAKRTNWRARLESRMLFLRDEYAYTGRGCLGRIAHIFSPSPAMTHVRNLCIPKDARILDVGSGDGRHLRVLFKQGYRNLTGVDPYLSRDQEYGSHIRIIKSRLEELRGKFDLIMAHHSLEHMPDQRAAFSSIADLLAPGGKILIRAPTVSSFAWERYGVHWAGLDAPRHFYLHSIKSIRLLAANAGFQINRILRDSIPFQFWASEQNQNGIFLYSRASLLKNPFKLIFAYRKLVLMNKKAVELNEKQSGDQFAMILEKG